MMKPEAIKLIILLLVSTVAFYFLLPFIDAILLAAVFSYALLPVVKKMEIYIPGKHSRSAAISIIFLLFLGIAALVGINMYSYLVTHPAELGDMVHKALSAAAESITPTLEQSGIKVDDVVQELRDISAQFAHKLIAIGPEILIETFVFSICLIYFLKDYDRIGKYIEDIAHHFRGFKTRKLLDETHLTMDALVRAWLIMAIIRGCMGMVGFIIFGVPHAIILGFLLAVMELMPLIGAYFVLIPVIVYEFAVGNVFEGIGIIVWSFIFLFLIADFYIRPRIITGYTRIHPAVIIIGFLAGVEFLGVAGAIIGPIILVLCLRVVEFLIEE